MSKPKKRKKSLKRILHLSKRDPFLPGELMRECEEILDEINEDREEEGVV